MWLLGDHGAFLELFGIHFQLNHKQYWNIQIQFYLFHLLETILATNSSIET